MKETTTITTITRITVRQYHSFERKPWDCTDTVIAHFASEETARKTLQNLVGENATVTVMGGIEFYNSPRHPIHEYILDTVEVW